MTPPRRLVLVRHAEAGPAAVDADRQLTPSGAREAAAVGRWLTDAGVRPDLVVVSPARRTRQTWDLAAHALAGAPRAVLDERLYEGTLGSVLDVVRATAREVATLVVVGHNPSLGHLAAVLGPRRPDELGRGFPPATAALFELGMPYDAVEPGVAAFVDARVPGG